MARIYVDGSRGKKEIVLGSREAHYLRDVLRMKKGDKVIVFDQEEGRGYIRDDSRKNMVISIEEWNEVREQRDVPVVLAQSILKGEKMDMVIEKSTEIGVTSIIPLISERVIPRCSGSEKKRRWERIAVEASRLCGRLMPPVISPPVSLYDFLEMDLPGMKIVPWEGEKETMLFDILKRIYREVTVVIGPEGGFHEKEIVLLRNAGFEAVSLGPLIFRSDTASIYTLSCITNSLWR